MFRRGYKEIIKRETHNLAVDLDEIARQGITLAEFFFRVPNDKCRVDWRV